MTRGIDVLSPSFVWATGIEDTFIAAPWHQTGRCMDEYELTDHYRQWRTDIALMRELGVRVARYGIPWYRLNPAPGRWDWEWTDRVLEHQLEVGIAPIVDLVHYGTPSWLEGAFLHPDYPERVAEYAAAVADRFHGRIRFYTPLNEPRITAWYCGRLGWWPPYRRGWRGYVAIMLAVARGIVRTEEALRAADPANVIVHVDATDLYRATTPAAAADVEHRQRLVFLALDLITGRVDEHHALAAWLSRHGATPEQLGWFRRRPVTLDVLGLNMYPMFTLKEVTVAGGTRIRMRYGNGAMVEELVRAYWERYRRPLMISETASLGSPARRLAWLGESVGAVRALRASAIPVIGYTWWPLFSLVAWAYRQRARELERYWLKMGLWDVDLRPGQELRRVRTRVADAYRALVAGGDAAVGPLASAAA